MVHRLLCLFANFSCLERHQTDRFLRPAHWEMAINQWWVLPRDQEGDLVSLAWEVCKGPLKVAPGSVSETSEQWHFSLLNPRRSSEDTVVDFSLSRMFLHLYLLGLLMASQSFAVSRFFPPFNPSLSPVCSPLQSTHLLICVSTSVVLTHIFTMILMYNWKAVLSWFPAFKAPPLILQGGKGKWPHSWLLNVRISKELQKQNKTKTNLGAFHQTVRVSVASKQPQSHIGPLHRLL